jgi:hypothetical protein
MSPEPDTLASTRPTFPDAFTSPEPWIPTSKLSPARPSTSTSALPRTWTDSSAGTATETCMCVCGE